MRPLEIGDHIWVEQGDYRDHAIYVGDTRVVRYARTQSGVVGRVEAVSLSAFAGDQECHVRRYQQTRFKPSEIALRALDRVGKDLSAVLATGEFFCEWCVTELVHGASRLPPPEHAQGGVLAINAAGECEIQYANLDPHRPVILFSSGFLSADDGEWSTYFAKNVDGHQLIRVRWESGSFRELAGLFYTPLAIPSALGLWRIAVGESERSGRVLGKALVRLADDLSRKGKPRLDITVVGHSLGARLMANCLDAMPKDGIRKAIFLGGALDSDADVLRRIDGKARQGIANYFSENDEVLRYLYKVGNLTSASTIGREPAAGQYKNIDVTHLVSGHTDYCNNTALIRQLFG